MSGLTQYKRRALGGAVLRFLAGAEGEASG